MPEQKLEFMDDEIMPELDIDTILAAVAIAENEGLTAEQMLDPQELAAYHEFMENDREEPAAHYDNLVPFIDSSFLGKLGGDIVNWVLWDEKTREGWSKREKEGIRALGVSDKVSGGAEFDGASVVVHPLLAKAAVQFHSRALIEMWPTDGPVKTIVLGNQTPERIAQSDRVESFMNFQYTEDMPGGFQEEDQMLFRLPLAGSCFKKLYFDPICRKLVSRFVEPADFIVPFSATDLSTAPRYTHRYRESHNVVMKKVASGYYIKGKKLTKPTNEMWNYPDVKTEIDDTEGRHRVGVDDNRHTILEMYIELDIPDFEHLGEDGEPTEIALPYTVWVDRDSQEVLRLQRNWRPDDEGMEARLAFAHYKFMPGLGFYGYGLYHFIGGMADSATGSLRALLDSAAFQNLQGGFRTRDSRIKGGDLTLKPGEWKEVDSSAEELAKAFFQVPRHEPSNVMFQLLGYLDENAKEFIGNAGVLTDNTNVNAPVGTTLALIEQGAKIESAIYLRLHIAHRDEFRILARLNSEYLPEQGYPYYTSGAERHIMPSDFDGRVDVIPVSDPSVIGNTTKILRAQAGFDLAKQFPDRLDLDLALKSMLEAIKIPNVDEWIKKDPAIAESQAKQQELAIAKLELENKKLQVEMDRLASQTTSENMTAIYQSIQAAMALLTNPAAIQTADTLLLSGGYVDHNGEPLATIANSAAQQGQMVQPQPEQNTSPQFPPTVPDPEQIQPPMPLPDMNIPSAAVGAGQGIETMRNDGRMLQ